MQMLSYLARDLLLLKKRRKGKRGTLWRAILSKKGQHKCADCNTRQLSGHPDDTDTSRINSVRNSSHLWASALNMCKMS